MSFCVVAGRGGACWTSFDAERIVDDDGDYLGVISSLLNGKCGSRILSGELSGNGG